MQNPIQDADAVRAQQGGTPGPRGFGAKDPTDVAWAVALVREAVAVLFASPSGARPESDGVAYANVGRPGRWDRGVRASHPTQPTVR